MLRFRACAWSSDKTRNHSKPSRTRLPPFKRSLYANLDAARLAKAQTKADLVAQRRNRAPPRLEPSVCTRAERGNAAARAPPRLRERQPSRADAQRCRRSRAVAAERRPRAHTAPLSAPAQAPRWSAPAAGTKKQSREAVRAALRRAREERRAAAQWEAKEEKGREQVTEQERTPTSCGSAARTRTSSSTTTSWAISTTARSMGAWRKAEEAAPKQGRGPRGSKDAVKKREAQGSARRRRGADDEMTQFLGWRRRSPQEPVAAVKQFGCESLIDGLGSGRD